MLGQRLLERKRAYLCTLPRCFAEKRPVYFHRILPKKQLPIFCLIPVKSLAANLSLLTLPSNWESCYLIEAAETGGTKYKQADG